MGATVLEAVNTNVVVGGEQQTLKPPAALRMLKRKITFSTPPLYMDPPPMDLGRFEISKGPSNNGGWTLDFSAV